MRALARLLIHNVDSALTMPANAQYDAIAQPALPA
jgi:hypothetical protein